MVRASSERQKMSQNRWAREFQGIYVAKSKWFANVSRIAGKPYVFMHG